MAQSLPDFGSDFFDPVENAKSQEEKVRWYMCTIVSLSSFNYPDLVPPIWDHLERHLFPGLSDEEQFQIARKLREALIKSCGIVGAAKTGTAMRTLCKCIPSKLKDTEAPRSKEDPAVASKRGHEFWSRIYARNPEFDPNATVAASPDYAYVVRDLLYGRIFSFDAILDDLETGYVIVSALIALDCQNQLRHHMKGMLYNGASRHDLEKLKDSGQDVAKRLGIRFRSTLQEVPSIAD